MIGQASRGSARCVTVTPRSGGCWHPLLNVCSQGRNASRQILSPLHLRSTTRHQQHHYITIIIIALLLAVTLRICRACFVVTMPRYMLDRPGLKIAQSNAKKAGQDDDKVEYRAILATLVRYKRKDRVPPSQNNDWYLFDNFIEKRYPKDRGTPISRDKPPKKPYACKLDCETCFTQCFPVRIGVTDEEALAGVQALSTAIREDREFLREVLSSHADAIVTRWRKKSKDKRTKLLAGLAPPDHNLTDSGPITEEGVGTSLCDEKWAAIHLINDRCRDNSKIPPLKEFANDLQMQLIERTLWDVMGKAVQEDSTVRHQTTWLLPYLEIETLAENPLLFLGLLHYRTVHGPVRSLPHIHTPAMQLTCCRKSG